MATTMLRPQAEKLKRKSTNGLQDVPKQCLSDARAVLDYSPELAEAVMRGDRPLQAALACHTGQ